jgi:hypothetical protein
MVMELISAASLQKEVFAFGGRPVVSLFRALLADEPVLFIPE